MPGPSTTGSLVRMSRRARWMLMGLAAAVSVLLLGAGLFYVSLLGGFDELWKGQRPQETDPEVVAARERASADLRVSGQLLARTAQASTSGTRLATGEVRSPCSVGQHNWKIDDPYDLSCDLGRLEIVASPSAAAFREHMVALDAALTADGWAPEGAFGMARVLRDYWDDRASFSSSYGVDNLPAATYSRGSWPDRQTLGVRWASLDSDSYAISYVRDGLDLESVKGGATTIAEVLVAIPPQGYAVVLTESVTYFEK